MTIHHVNCGSLRPRASFGGRVTPQRMVSHCLLVERPAGLLLVDTGFGTGDIAEPGRLGRPFVTAFRPSLALAETALAHVEARGFTSDDVTDIVLTHLDLDHAGGIGDFPRARVHVFADELAAALHPSVRERARYISAQWAHGPRWERHEVLGDDWFGFRSVSALGDDVVLVPLRGHSRGHCGVAVRRADGGWVLHAGDSYFHSSEKENAPHPPVGLIVFQRMVAVDNLDRTHNQERLRELHAQHREDVTIFCAHDATELDALAGG